MPIKFGFHNFMFPLRDEGDEIINDDNPNPDDDQNDDEDDNQNDDDDNDDLDELNKDDDDNQDDDDSDDDDDDNDDNDDKDDDDNDDDKLLGKNVTYSDIKKEFPELFKKFPELKTQFFRGQEFDKRFGSLKEADAALTAQENYQELRQLVISGNAGKILEDVNEISPKSLTKFATNFLPALHRVNKELFVEITKPVIKNILAEVLKHGKNQNNENIQRAAKLVNRLVFDEEDLKGINIKEDVDEPSEEEKEQLGERYRSLANSVGTEIENDLNKAIEKGLDPSGMLKEKPNLKKRIIKAINEEIREQLDSDEAHLGRMRSLWNRERRNGFSGQLKDSIKTAFLSRAIALMPKIRQQVRADFLGVEKGKDKKLKDNIKNRREGIPAGRQANNKDVITVDKARKKGMTDMDILNA